MSSKQLAADVFAARDGGNAEPPDAFHWPVSDAEYNVLCRSALDAYMAVLAGLGDIPDRDLLQADFTFLVALLQHAHGLWVEERCRAVGVELRLGSLSRSIYHPDWAELACSPGVRR